MNKSVVLVLRKGVALAIPLLLAFVVWQIMVAPLLTLNRDLDEDAERSQLLLRHYRLLMSQAGEVNSELQRLKENSGADDLFYSTQNVNAAATLLQQKLGELVAATGGQIRAARVETKPKTPNYEPFAVNLTFATSSAGLAKLLFQLETLRPIVLVDGVFINSGPALQALQHSTNAADNDKRAAEDQVLDVALTVAAFALTKG
jgi:Type II secretion system (T2SS), protein M subtype b